VRMVARSNILYCLVANGPRILVSKRLRDGNFVQYAKKILASGLDQDGDHCRSCVFVLVFCPLFAHFALPATSTTRGSLRSTCW
jgi:hypothetical protein